MTPPDLAGIIERDRQSVTWADFDAEVPQRVSDAVWQAAADRRALLGLLRETRDIMQAVREDSARWWVQPRIGSGSIESRLPSEAVHFTESMTHLRVYLSALSALAEP